MNDQKKGKSKISTKKQVEPIVVQPAGPEDGTRVFVKLSKKKKSEE